jgi:hypothetical protein
VTRDKRNNTVRIAAVVALLSMVFGSGEPMAPTSLLGGVALWVLIISGVIALVRKVKGIRATQHEPSR